MNHDLIIARYGEIGLKSPKIRSRFEKKLVKNIKATFECDVDRNQGRIYIFPNDFDEGIEKLNRVLVSFPILRQHQHMLLMMRLMKL